MVVLKPTTNLNVGTPSKAPHQNMQKNAMEQNKLNQLYAGGKKTKKRHRKYYSRGGATANILGSRYVSYSGKGQTPTDTQVDIVKNANQSTEWSKYDYLAKQKGGRRRYSRKRRSTRRTKRRT